jgi:hypothetical protein
LEEEMMAAAVVVLYFDHYLGKIKDAVNISINKTNIYIYTIC